MAWMNILGGALKGLGGFGGLGGGVLGGIGSAMQQQGQQNDFQNLIAKIMAGQQGAPRPPGSDWSTMLRPMGQPEGLENIISRSGMGGGNFGAIGGALGGGIGSMAGGIFGPKGGPGMSPDLLQLLLQRKMGGMFGRFKGGSPFGDLQNAPDNPYIMT
jgi:hypothetical protein